jgi:hypothetical protein
MYGVAQGGGISISTLPVNTPLQSALNLPANNATNISTSPTLSWTPVCAPDSFRLQIATDSLFVNMLLNQGKITTTSLTIPAGILVGSNKFYWRVAGVNAAGVGKWTGVNTFSTNSVVNCVAANSVFVSNVTGSTYQWQVNTGAGFVNISDDINYSGSTTNSMHLTGANTAWYGYQYQCLVNGISGNIYTLKFASFWNGAASTIWANPLNWNCGAVPDANTDAILNSGTILVNATAVCRSVSVAPGVIFAVNSGVNFTVTK